MPLWMLEIYAENIGALQAEEIQQSATVALLPYVEADERRRFLSRIESLLQRESASEGVGYNACLTEQVIEENPDKARAWFEEQGIRVERGHGDHAPTRET